MRVILTLFFYVKMNMRKYQKNIKALYDENGDRIFNSIQLQEWVEQYYTNLFNGQ